MKIYRFEDIIAWKKAQDLGVQVYNEFQSTQDFAFKDQICRAAVSISNNIAEGFDRGSNADFSRFLYYSLGSCSEVKSMLYMAERLRYIGEIKTIELISQCDEISKIIRGLIKVLVSSKL